MSIGVSVRTDRKIIVSISFLCTFFPTICYGNGGGPLLLFISGGIFVFGQVWIVASETYIFRRETAETTMKSLGIVTLLNIASTIIVGTGFPLVLAMVTLLGMVKLPEPWAELFQILGTWFFSKIPHPEITIYVSIAWLVITFVLTVYFEKWLLVRFFSKYMLLSKSLFNRLVIKMHAVSYTGLALIVLFFSLV